MAHAEKAGLLPDASDSFLKTDVEASFFEAAGKGEPLPDLAAYAESLKQVPYVTINEVGGGVVPLEQSLREAREQAGRLSVLLAKDAEEVYRVFCGIPQKVK